MQECPEPVGIDKGEDIMLEDMAVVRLVVLILGNFSEEWENRDF